MSFTVQAAPWPHPNSLANLRPWTDDDRAKPGPARQGRATTRIKLARYIRDHSRDGREMADFMFKFLRGEVLRLPMFRQLRSQKGLTLVELMVVVTIIAIIAAVAITVVQDIQRKAKLAADEDNVAAMRSAVAIYYGKHGTFPESFGHVESLVTPPPTWQCSGATKTYDKNNGKIEFTATLTECP
jgi:prepilin-type N-terminal cleavage/methylation domain-containing protein